MSRSNITDKNQCLRLTRRPNTERRPFIRRSSGKAIEVKEAAKLLGVIIDQELRWHNHVESVVAKGQKLLLACNRLTRPTFGLPAKFVRQLFTSIVAPAVEYAIPVWFFPPHHVADRNAQVGSVLHCRLLGKIQRMAGILITGAFRTTPTDLLDLHANLPPVALRLSNICHRETVRLCTLPKSHPLHAAVTSNPMRQASTPISPFPPSQPTLPLPTTT